MSKEWKKFDIYWLNHRTIYAIEQQSHKSTYMEEGIEKKITKIYSFK